MKRKTSYNLRLLVPWLAWLLTGCLGTVEEPATEEPATAARLAVAVSLAPQAWLVEEIGAERVDVTVLVRPGESPATFQPNDAEVSQLMRSMLYLRLGVPFEKGSWLDAVAGAGRPHVVDIRQGIELRPIDGHACESADHAGESLDPHVWLSPPLLAVLARNTAAALIAEDPAHQAHYETALARLEARLDDLDQRLQEKLEPLSGHSFFVFHPVWGYFAERYGLHQIAIEIAGREPADRELTELQRQAEAEGASVIFVQPQIQGRAAEAVATAIGGRVEVVDPLQRDVMAGLESMAERLLAASGNKE